MAKETKEDLLQKCLPALGSGEMVYFYETGYMRKGKGFNSPPDKGLLIVTDRRSYFFAGKGLHRILAAPHNGITKDGVKITADTSKFSLPFDDKEIVFSGFPRYFNVEEVVKFIKKAALTLASEEMEDLTRPVLSAPTPPAGAPVLWDAPPPPAAEQAMAFQDSSDVFKVKIQLLREMLDDGIITEAEYYAKRSRLLDGLI